MSIKSILTPFFGSEDAAALKTAIGLAKKHEAALEALYVTPDLHEGIVTYSGGFFWPSDYSERLVADFMAEAQRQEAAARTLFGTICSSMKVDVCEDDETPAFPSARFVSLQGHPARLLALHARLADLVVMTRDFGKRDNNMDIVQHALFKTGRPVLLVPGDKPATAAFDKVLVAWNGSFEAARAVHLSLPLLQGAAVRVFTGIEGDEPPAVGAEELVAYLKRQGVKAEGVTVSLANETPEEAIRRAMREFGASMLVMGAFSRENRLREALLGSLTGEILGNADFPVLMAN